MDMCLEKMQGIKSFRQLDRIWNFTFFKWQNDGVLHSTFRLNKMILKGDIQSGNFGISRQAKLERMAQLVE